MRGLLNMTLPFHTTTLSLSLFWFALKQASVYTCLFFCLMNCCLPDLRQLGSYVVPSTIITWECCYIPWQLKSVLSVVWEASLSLSLLDILRGVVTSWAFGKVYSLTICYFGSWWWQRNNPSSQTTQVYSSLVFMTAVITWQHLHSSSTWHFIIFPSEGPHFQRKLYGLTKLKWNQKC